MMKTCLFLILVLLMRPVFAASMMTHEKFVHLNYEDQKKIVVAAMELVVEMEEKYKHQVKTSGYNEERFRRYTELIRKVTSVIFPEAHARSQRYERIGQYMEQFKSIIRSTDKCIYGGWPSTMSGNLCVHPSSPLNRAFRNSYFSENNCQGINQISCNPAIFGFRHVDRGTLFCVSAGKSGTAADAPSDNTSRECMKKALAPSNDPNVSSPAERIANLVDGIRRNPSDSDAIFDFLLKACACEARSPAISQHYHSYMRPHRTCYSILKMMSEVMPECSAGISPMNEQQSSFLAHIRNSISQEEINSATPNTIDAVYSQVVNGFVSRPEYASICGTTPGPAPIPGPTQCPEARRLENGTCCEGATPLPNPAKTECIANPTGGGVVVDTTSSACPVAGQIRNAAGQCETPVTTGGGGDTGPGPTPTPTPDPVTCDLTVNDLIGTQCLIKCPEGVTRAADNTCPGTTAPTCDLTTHEMIGGNCVIKCVEGTGPRNTTTNACNETCTDTTKDYVAATRTCADKCPADRPRNTAGVCGGEASTHTITIRSTIKDLNSTTITATVSGNTSVPAGHTIIWFKKGTNITNLTFTGTNGPAPTSEAPVLSTVGEEIADPPPTTSTNTTWDDAGTNETSIPASTDDMEFIAPRHTENYEVCARLVKISDRSLVDSKCEIVQKKTPPAGQGGFNPGQQQMGPTRGGASDAIFRGIR